MKRALTKCPETVDHYSLDESQNPNQTAKAIIVVNVIALLRWNDGYK